MRVAICDDDIIAINLLRGYLEQHENISALRSFLSPERLLDAIRQGECFDAVFMDIDWKQDLNGIDYACAINGESPLTLIIYVTGYNDRFSQNIFLKPSNLCGYLIKPVDPSLLDTILQKAWGIVQNQVVQKLVIKYNNAVHAIPYHTIRYIESQGHQLLIHSLQNTVICYERLELLKKRLPKQFLHCHKSYLVNLDYVRHIENRRINLRDGEELPVSKARYAETRLMYFRYIGEQL